MQNNKNIQVEGSLCLQTSIRLRAKRLIVSLVLHMWQNFMNYFFGRCIVFNGREESLLHWRYAYIHVRDWSMLTTRKSPWEGKREYFDQIVSFFCGFVGCSRFHTSTYVRTWERSLGGKITGEIGQTHWIFKWNAKGMFG